jgi:Phage tail lysozyme
MKGSSLNATALPVQPQVLAAAPPTLANPKPYSAYSTVVPYTGLLAPNTAPYAVQIPPQTTTPAWPQQQAMVVNNPPATFAFMNAPPPVFALLDEAAAMSASTNAATNASDNVLSDIMPQLQQAEALLKTPLSSTSTPTNAFAPNDSGLGAVLGQYDQQINGMVQAYTAKSKGKKTASTLQQQEALLKQLAGELHTDFSGTASGGTLSKAQLQRLNQAVPGLDTQKAEAIYNYFVTKKGYTPKAASILLANVIQEVGPQIDLTAISYDGRGSQGLIQYTDDRLVALKDWAKQQGKDPYALSTQLDYFEMDVKRDRGAAAERFFTAMRNPNASEDTLWQEMKQLIRWGEAGNRYAYGDKITAAIA